MLTLSRRGRRPLDVWPAFVDALASLLLVLIFMLLVFVIGQFVLGLALAGRERTVDALDRQVRALAETLALERTRSEELAGRAERFRVQTETLTTRERALSDQVGELLAQLSRLEAALAAREAEVGAKQAEIERLGERLNVELARRVEELSRYRSEFFGRLRQILGQHPSIRIVGDRFVFQSELLFPSGSATLTPEGQQRLAELAQTLKAVTADIPPEIPWVLRVDGHTDVRPITTARFVSNWELSTARALSVVRFLIAQGIPPDRLAAAGFGEHHPIDPGPGPEAYARNRRIEIKLDRR